MNPDEVARGAEQSEKYKGMPAQPAPDADLGLAMLIAEGANHEYEPVAVVASIRDAAEHALGDLTSRLCALDHGVEPLRPCSYVLWARGEDGSYGRHYTITLRRGDA